MSAESLQKQVASFVEKHQLQTDVSYRLLDLTSEVGELSKEMLKRTQYGKVAFRPDDAWADELGDVLFALLCLAEQTDVDAETALENSLRKYELRISKNNDPGSAST
jgi:NTP pyrophosphatase (non-canonical NTP hydrolase)